MDHFELEHHWQQKSLPQQTGKPRVHLVLAISLFLVVGVVGYVIFVKINTGTISPSTATTSTTVTEVPVCHSQFFLWSFDEFEKMFPALAECHLTTYAHIAQEAALKSPCRDESPEMARILMIPPYLAQDCNWPGYGGGWCGGVNQYRPGKLCHTEVTSSVRNWQNQGHWQGKLILFIDQSTLWEPYDLRVADYNTPGWIFAKGNSRLGIYREGIDVSMPPSAFPRCSAVPSKAYTEPLTAKRYFLTFKGQLHTAIRDKARRILHNGKDILILAREQKLPDFDDLLQSSRFNLILGGDIEFSYRFNEAICSGGVPVFVTTRWVPPFNESVNFETYGVFVWEKDLEGLETLLRSFTDEEVALRRGRARTACQSMFQTNQVQVAALLSFLTKGTGSHWGHIDQAHAPRPFMIA